MRIILTNQLLKILTSNLDTVLKHYHSEIAADDTSLNSLCMHDRTRTELTGLCPSVRRPNAHILKMNRIEYFQHKLTSPLQFPGGVCYALASHNFLVIMDLLRHFFFHFSLRSHLILYIL